MTSKFIEKLERTISEKQTHIALMIAPQMIKMPLPMKRHDDPFFPFGKEIIRATKAITPVYLFDLAAYLRLGAAGAIALERTMSYAVAECVLVLHGPFAGPAYVEISDENAFASDAVTLHSLQNAAAYLQRQDRGVFVLEQQEIAIDSYPQNVGGYNPHQGQLHITGRDGLIISLRVFGDDAIYASAEEDYAAQARHYLEVHSE